MSINNRTHYNDFGDFGDVDLYAKKCKIPNKEPYILERTSTRYPLSKYKYEFYSQLTFDFENQVRNSRRSCNGNKDIQKNELSGVEMSKLDKNYSQDRFYIMACGGGPNNTKISIYDLDLSNNQIDPTCKRISHIDTELNLIEGNIKHYNGKYLISCCDTTTLKQYYFDVNLSQINCTNKNFENPISGFCVNSVGVNPICYVISNDIFYSIPLNEQVKWYNYSLDKNDFWKNIHCGAHPLIVFLNGDTTYISVDLRDGISNRLYRCTDRADVTKNVLNEIILSTLPLSDVSPFLHLIQSNLSTVILDTRWPNNFLETINIRDEQYLDYCNFIPRSDDNLIVFSDKYMNMMEYHVLTGNHHFESQINTIFDGSEVENNDYTQFQFIGTPYQLCRNIFPKQLNYYLTRSRGMFSGILQKSVLFHVEWLNSNSKFDVLSLVKMNMKTDKF
ncbi:hypothetical protein A3Q56_03057 [Intoshia linei]|uniref:Uncharacterized protein n=1 Tax=Intoshia linei TaxID=1819745 RepID=A0A177B6G1_9BILA|nr:hypothetical protein A3Q56_03057 [Intoshia linei]